MLANIRMSMTVSGLLLLAGCSEMQTTGPAAATQPAQRRWTFDHDRAGQLPPGWIVRQTGATGTLATWQVAEDPTAPSPPNVLALINTHNRGSTFNLAIVEGTSFKDLDLSVKIKGRTGSEDQGGGPIWRCRDEDNYYVCRINPLENNFRVYKVVGGKRTQLATTEFKAQTGRWYTVRAVMQGPDIECYVDGQKLLTASDEAIRTPGMIGLWTKADAASSFDNLTVTPK